MSTSISCSATQDESHNLRVRMERAERRDKVYREVVHAIYMSPMNYKIRAYADYHGIALSDLYTTILDMHEKDRTLEDFISEVDHLTKKAYDMACLEYHKRFVSCSPNVVRDL